MRYINFIHVCLYRWDAIIVQLVEDIIKIKKENLDPKEIESQIEQQGLKALRWSISSVEKDHLKINYVAIKY